MNKIKHALLITLFLWVAFAATQIMLPQLVNFYYLMSHYWQITMACLGLIGFFLLLKLMSADL